MKPEIAEINLLGTGGGYGESLVIHLANNEWIVIDSCIDPNSKESLPLKFLKEKGIDLSNVQLILCTHWHDDHIRGISSLLKYCPNAIFSTSKVTGKKKFLQIVGLEHQKENFSASNSSTKEFHKCLEIIDKREKPLKLSEIDKTLYSTTYKNIDIKIHSLSPSDYSARLFDHEISELMDRYSPVNKKIPNQSLNDRSVVLLLEIGSHSVLLGADLEVKSNPDLGWLDIIHNSQTVKTAYPSKYYKIPHHGSSNGYHSDIFDNLLGKNPIGSLTPRHPSPSLPTEKMMEKYGSLMKELYFTSNPHNSSKPKKRDHKTTKIIKKINSSVQEIRFNYGIITSRVNILNPGNEWHTISEGDGFIYGSSP